MNILQSANAANLRIAQLADEITSLKVRVDALKEGMKKEGFNVFFGTNGVTISKGVPGEYAILDYEGNVKVTLFSDADTAVVVFLMTN